MQFLAQITLAILAICVLFWVLGFWWGLGVLVLFGLIGLANGGDRA